MLDKYAREHATRRSEFLRSHGTLSGTLWETATNGAVWTIRPEIWTEQIQQIVQLLGLFVGRPRTHVHASSPLPSTGGSVERAGLGQVLHNVPAIWEGQCDATPFAGLQGLAHAETRRRCSAALESSSVSNFDGGISETSPASQVRCTRRRIDQRVEDTIDPDKFQLLELSLSWMGSQFQVPQAHQTGSFELPTAARNASMDDSVVHSDKFHSQVCGHEANAQRIPGRPTDLNPMAPGHFCQDTRELGALQFGEQVMRQRADSAGGNAPPAHGTPEEPLGQCHSTEAAEMIRILANQIWSNPGNHC